MPRIILIALLLVAAWLAFELLRRRLRRTIGELRQASPLFELLFGGERGVGVPRGTAAGPAGATQHLVRCRRCGVHVAERTSLAGDGGPWCSTACRDARPTAPADP